MIVSCKALERFFPTTLMDTSSGQHQHAVGDGLAHMSNQAEAGMQITPMQSCEHLATTNRGNG
jgi:hypothetical protein